MGEASPTRNRKSGGRAWRKEGREGASPDQGGWGLGDHRKSNYGRKRKGEAWFWEGIGTKTTAEGRGK
jgi:hypothetical protein